MAKHSLGFKAKCTKCGIEYIAGDCIGPYCDECENYKHFKKMSEHTKEEIEKLENRLFKINKKISEYRYKRCIRFVTGKDCQMRNPCYSCDIFKMEKK